MLNNCLLFNFIFVVEGVELDCRKNDMIFIVFKFFFKGVDWYYLILKEKDCLVFENRIYFFMIILLIGCKIMFRYCGNFVIYSNMVREILIK